MGKTVGDISHPEVFAEPSGTIKLDNALLRCYRLSNKQAFPSAK